MKEAVFAARLRRCRPTIRHAVLHPVLVLEAQPTRGIKADFTPPCNDDSRKTQELPLAVIPCKLRGLSLTATETARIFRSFVEAMAAPTTPDAALLIARRLRACRAATMEPAAHAYVAGGAGDEITQRDNERRLGRLAIRPRMLVGVGGATPAWSCWAAAPAPGADRADRLPAAGPPRRRDRHRAGGGRDRQRSCASRRWPRQHPRRWPRRVPDGARWFQLYVFNDRGVSRELVARAAEHGFEALVVTVDLPVLGRPRARAADAACRRPRDAASGADAAGASGPMTPASSPR